MGALAVIVDRVKESTLRRRLRWVKARQDEKKPCEDLDKWGRMSCDADKMAEKFRRLMDDGDAKSLKEGLFVESMEVGITVKGVKVTSHVTHQIRSHVQGSKHRKYLQKKREWGDATCNSVDWRGVKSGFLSLGPLRRIKTSKSIHGWLNAGRQKEKMSPDAADSHKCPRRLEPSEDHEHALKRRHVSARKKRHDLVHPMVNKIRQNNLCPAQEAFTTRAKSWLESPETLVPGVSSARATQRELIEKAMADQDRVGWRLAMRGCLSKRWKLAASASRLPGGGQ